MPRLTAVLAALLVATGLAGGCSLFDSNQSTTVTPRPVDLSRFEADTTALEGRWQWVRTTVYTMDGDVTVSSPSSTGTTRALRFLTTDTVEVYKNDRLTSRTPTADYLDRPAWGIRNDTLVITTAFLDGPEKIYVRD